jgi:hypothetical protein
VGEGGEEFVTIIAKRPLSHTKYKIREIVCPDHLAVSQAT